MHAFRSALLAAALTSSAAPLCASERPLPEPVPGWEIGFAAGIDVTSKQLTYGLIDNPHAIVTPSAEVSFGREDLLTVTVSVEAIFDTTDYGAKEGGYNDRRWKYQELAPGLTLSRTWDTESWLGSSLDTAVNYTYEYHPKSCKKPAEGYSNPGTQWLNFEASAGDFWLVPTFTLEYALDDRQDAQGGIYATFDLSHGFDLGPSFGFDEGTLTLTPRLGVAAATKQRNQADFGSNDAFMFRDAFGLLELNVSPVEGLSVTPYVGFHQQIDSAARDATGDDQFVAYAGLALSAEF